MEIINAPFSGLCYGAREAINLTKKALMTGNPTVCESDILHNQDLMNSLIKLGLNKISKERTVGEKDQYIITAHGAGPTERKKIQDLGYHVVNTTCRHVQLFQGEVVSSVLHGYEIVIYGKKDHREIEGVVDWITSMGGKFRIIESYDENILDSIISQKIALFPQTTINRDSFLKVSNYLRSKSIPDLKIHDNILCDIVRKRVQAAIDMAPSVDLMVVVGSKESNNTIELTSAIGNAGYKVQQIEGKNISSDLEEYIIKNNISKIGVTAGSSTPDETVNTIISKLKEY